MEGLAVPFPHLLPLPPVPKLGTVSAAISTSTSTPTGNYLLTLLALHSNNFPNLHFISSYLLATILYRRRRRRRRRRRIHLSQTTASTTSFSLLYIIIIALPA
jgi:hypothetical protein